MSDSVMDWLSETQINLANINAEEKNAKNITSVSHNYMLH